MLNASEFIFGRIPIQEDCSVAELDRQDQKQTPIPACYKKLTRCYLCETTLCELCSIPSALLGRFVNARREIIHVLAVLEIEGPRCAHPRNGNSGC
jgi:hypothetical protein